MSDAFQPPMAEAFAAVSSQVALLMEGLYQCDTHMLEKVFHPLAHYVCATTGTLTFLSVQEYLDVVAAREAPATRNEPRNLELLGLHFAGPATALVQLKSTLGGKHFTDFLTFVMLDGQWRVISKVFHFEMQQS